MADPLDKPILLNDAVWHRCMFPSKERLAEDREWWSKYLKRDVSLEETAEICHNVFGLFKILFEVDARVRAQKAGLPVVDQEKVDRLHREIGHLEEQIATTQKMIRRWPKGAPQRLALEQALQALEQEAIVKREAVTQELNPVAAPTTKTKAAVRRPAKGK